MALPDIAEIVKITTRNRARKFWEEKHMRVVYSDAAVARIIASTKKSGSKEPAIRALINAFMDTERPIFTMNSEPVDEIHLA